MNRHRLRQFLALFLVVVHAVQHNTADLCRNIRWGSNAGGDFCVCGNPRKCSQ